MKARTRTTQDWQTEAIYRLVAKVYRQALAEAWRGSKAAQTWLDIVCPEWRTLQQKSVTRALSRKYSSVKDE
mgnify:FL=1